MRTVERVVVVAVVVDDDDNDDDDIGDGLACACLAST